MSSALRSLSRALPPWKSVVRAFRVGIALTIVFVAQIGVAEAAPSGTLRTTENPDGSFNVLTSVTWDQCPDVCDWKVTVHPVESAAQCPQQALNNIPEGMAYGVGIPLYPDNRPSSSNGTRSMGMVNLYYARPFYTHLCFAAVGLAINTSGAYSPSDECPDPGSGPYLNESPGTGAGRCPRLYPLGAVLLPAAAQPLRPPLPLAGSFVKISEARRALRARGIRGDVQMRRLSARVVRARVRNARGTRLYRITKNRGKVRVRRA